MVALVLSLSLCQVEQRKIIILTATHQLYPGVELIFSQRRKPTFEIESKYTRSAICIFIHYVGKCFSILRQALLFWTMIELYSFKYYQEYRG
jgi:hypothetical protein